jgi:hypothetical protein
MLALFAAATLFNALLVLISLVGILNFLGLPGGGLVVVRDGKDLFFFAILIIVTVRLMAGWRKLLRRVRDNSATD